MGDGRGPIGTVMVGSDRIKGELGSIRVISPTYIVY